MGRHILVKLRVLAGSAVVLGMLCAALAAGCIEDKGQQPAEYEPNLQPLQVHVWMDVSDGAEFPDKLIWKGIREAHGLRSVLAGRKVDLVQENPGVRTFDSLEAVADLAREKNVEGPILFRSSRVFGSNGEFSRDSGTFISIVPSVQDLFDKSRGCAIQVGSSLEERARSAALFARATLGAVDAIILLDQEAPDSIVLASIFSSEMIRLGGSISEVRILPDGNADFGDVLRSVKEQNPGVIYIPYSEKTSIPAIELLQKQEQRSSILVVNVPQEERFLARGGESLEGVYLVTDYHPRSTRSGRMLEYIRHVLRIPGHRGYEEPFAVLGADSYFLLFDLLEEVEPLMVDINPASEQEDVDSTIRSRHSGKVPRNLYVCRVEMGLLRGPHLEYIESVDPSGLRS